MRTPRIVRRAVPALGEWPDEVHPVLRRVYAARGVLSHAESQPRLQCLLPPDALGGIDAASARLVHAIGDDRRIVIVGDFDCDGATGVAVGVRGLRMLGANQVAYQVPHRILHGYGLTTALVEAMEPLRPELVVTVDNGIACHAGIAAAKARGWDVIVTDHHLPGASLPPADAIVNPNLPGDLFPSKALAGVGVMFYLLLATRRLLRESGRANEADLSTLLDLVAVGTVADMVPLDANNRILVAAGLRRLREGRCQEGLRALSVVAGRPLERLVAGDIGFFIGPRINAAGRLEDMAIGIECLLADDPAHAAQLAHTLDTINRERRGVQDVMLEDAGRHLETVDSGEERASCCVHDAAWHPGVVGLVASRLKERLHRPSIAFAPASPGSDEWRGSARSIQGFHIRDALAEVHALHPQLIQRFGGHAMAAGLGILESNLAPFAEAFETVARLRIPPECLDETVVSDGELDAGQATLDLAWQLRWGGPWGQGFPEPLFDGEFGVAGWRCVGEKHLKMQLEQRGRRIDAIAFNGWDEAPAPARVRIAYRLDINEWRETQNLQFIVVHHERL